MLDNLKPKSEFSRNVLTLVTGITIAQAIPIAVGPILSRMYASRYFSYSLFSCILYTHISFYGQNMTEEQLKRIFFEN